MTKQLSLFGQTPRPVGPGPQGVTTPDAPPEPDPEPQPMTKRAQMKALREELRYAQMQVRLDIYGYKLATAKVKRIAEAMRNLQKT